MIDFTSDYLFLLWEYYGLPIEQDIRTKHCDEWNGVQTDPKLYRLIDRRYRVEKNIDDLLLNDSRIAEPLTDKETKELKQRLLDSIEYGEPIGALRIGGQDLKMLILAYRIGNTSPDECNIDEYNLTDLLDALYNDLLYPEALSFATTILKAGDEMYSSVARGGKILGRLGWNAERNVLETDGNEEGKSGLKLICLADIPLRPLGVDVEDGREWGSIVLSLINVNLFPRVCATNDKWGRCLRDQSKGRLSRLAEKIENPPSPKPVIPPALKRRK